MIGIVTITVDSNYGNRLQNYAVQQVLKTLGKEPETLFIKESFIQKIKDILRILTGRRRFSLIKKRRDFRFRGFNKKYLNIVGAKEKKIRTLNDIDEFEYVICGSDQIWNFTLPFIRIKSNFFFAKFVEPEKRIAFSASIGVDGIPQDCVDMFTNGINGMKCISVREERGREIIKELTDRDVAVTVDPTLMLSREEWRKLEKKPSFIKDKGKYILTYFLGVCSEEVRRYIDKIVHESGMKVISLYGEFLGKSEIGNKKWFVTNPGEFLWLIDHCELMMTDSFHGCIFSIINKVPFRCFKRGGGAVDMSSRMATLFGKLNIENWCRGDTNEDINHLFYSDYSLTDEIIEKEKIFAYDYLKGALNINEI